MFKDIFLSFSNFIFYQKVSVANWKIYLQGHTVYESVNYPGLYIIHDNYRLKISQYDGSEVMRKSSSFLKVDGN